MCGKAVRVDVKDGLGEQLHSHVVLDDVIKQADKKAALACMTAFANTDFRDDLAEVDVATLVIHGDSDAVVPFDGFAPGPTPPSAERTARHRRRPARRERQHAAEWNATLLTFLAK